MGDTALKFGPEWLRALSHGDTPVSPPPSPSLGAPTRYKLAQHRYGREEMLALFDKNVKVPDDLSTAPPLYVEKTQLPLALIQMTDDEMRMWQRGVNSDVVLKLMGRNSGTSPGGPSPVSARGRGASSMDRGRGRGRGMGSPVGPYNRGTSYEDEGGEHGRRDGPPTGYGRGTRPFERSQSSTERVWGDRSERNGTDADWNGSASPRKEFGNARTGTGDNWRSREALKAEGKDEDDGWRTAGRNDRWGRSGWRTERENDRETAGSADKRDAWAESPGNAGDRHRNAWEEEGRSPASGFFANKRQGARRAWDENDTLPEWAAEDMQGGGTFDSSGAFRDERWSDEEDADGKKKRVLKRREDEQPALNGIEPPITEPLAQSTESVPDSIDSPNDELSSTNSPLTAQRTPTATPPSVAAESASPARSPVCDGAPVRVDEDGLEHAQAVVSTLVAQLVEDEDQPKPTPSPPTAIPGMDQWFYRDPQGEVQGPFSSTEMAEWFNSGYFTMALSVRRACDERYVQLGELTKMWGRLPFLTGPTVPPLKATDVHPMVAEQEKLQMIQQHLLQQQLFQQQMMQQQHMMRQQAVVAKLSQMEGWGALSPLQQQQIVSQHMASMGPILGSDPLYQQLRLQMEAQAKLQADLMMQRKDPVHSLMSQLQQSQQPKLHEAVLPEPAKHDPIQALVQQLLGQKQAPPAPVAKPEKPLDPIQSLLQQAQWGAGPNQNAVPSEPHLPSIAPGFHGMTPASGLVPWPPHTMNFGAPSSLFPAVPSDTPVTSVWDLENAKVEEVKRQQIEQQHQLELQRREAEEEEKRRKEEDERRQRERELQQQEEERLRMEEMRREVERQQQLQQQQQQHVEEMRRRELQQQQQQEEKRRQEEEKRKRDEELKQLQLEEERIKREEERSRKEEEKATEQQRRQQEALQRLQEQQAIAQAQARAAQLAAQQIAQTQQQQQQQQKAAPAPLAPWAQQQQQQGPSDSLTIAEIQKLQEEKEAKERALAQAQKAEQAAKAAALLKQQEQQAAIKLRWAKQNSAQASTTKSLAEIQAEEAAQLARQKEKEAKEKANQVANMNLVQSSAWGSSHSSSAWSSGRTVAAVVAQNPANNSNVWKAGSVGFWEDPAPPKTQQKVKQVAQPAQQQPAKIPATPAMTKPQAKPSVANATAVRPAHQQQQQQQQSAPAKKNKSSKEEEAAKRASNQTTEKKDNFSQWCFEYLKKVQAPIDVPTFVAFLKDVESPFEVQDYVRSYLGEGKEAKEFAKQFLEQRSKWRQQLRNAQHEEDNMCIPAKAVNPGQSSDFHEVKSKSKKSKKKMQKVDASLLGFSVSASTDRINVGERDFVEGM